MIAISMDARKARRQLARIERSLSSAEKRAMKLAGSNVRRAYIAGLKGGKPEALHAPVAPLNEPWREIMHPGKPMGGVFLNGYVWAIVPVHHGVVVDATRKLQKILERWQYGSPERTARLQQLVTKLNSDPATRRWYHHEFAPQNPSWPRDISAIPAVARQPLREVAPSIRIWAREHLGEWYLKILRKLSGGAIKPYSKRTA